MLCCSNWLLLTSAPGEVHTLGLSIVSEFFMRAGWDVDAHFLPAEPVARQVQTTWYDVVGFSLAATMHLEALTQTVAAVRRASRNPQVTIVVGGPAVAHHPALLAPVQADLLLSDAALAPDQVAQFLAARRHVN